MRSHLVVAACTAISLVSASAAALQQPNGKSIPTAPGCNSNMPTGLLAAFACACTQPGVCNIGAPCSGPTSCDNGQHGTCESTMWHAFNDNTCIPSMSSGLDPASEAATTPETFHPTCGLTFSVISRGTAIFHNVFGWYNATGAAPAASDLHPMINCGDTVGAKVTLDIKSQPAYQGGDVGFFLLTPEGHPGTGACASGDCCPTVARWQAGEGYAYYSQKEWNPDGQGMNPYIHLLVYASHLEPHRFYFAWEDTFDTSSADFTDLVTSVDGVDCSGSGVACPTGKQGVCALGLTACAAGVLGCTEVLKPGAEACNGVDDDCNGQVDDDAPCPQAGDVCSAGVCVPRCGGTEFPCSGETQCDAASGRCVATGCAGVSCAPGTVCRAGACVTPCQGVVCPAGQTCDADECKDLCAKVACSAGQICRQGVCLPGCNACGGVACAPPLSCGPSGECADPSCAAGCGAGAVCSAGACVDACAGAKCPSAQGCAMGRCGAGGSPGLGEMDGGPPAEAGAPAPGPDGGADAAPDAAFADEAPAKGGCGCRLARPIQGGGGGALAALLGLAAARRRRRPGEG